MNTLSNIIRQFTSGQLGDQLKKMDLGLKWYESVESINLLDDESPFQAELIFNRFLPYAEQLNDEADQLLAEIKARLGHCILTGDIDPGCIYWSRVLTEYISLYSFRFTKDEHLAFIKLYYELITIPDLSIPLLRRFISILTTLMKKKRLISPKELELQWEPLYKLCRKIIYYNSKTWAPHRYPAEIEVNLEILVHKTRRYFPSTATQQILDELRPQIYPFNKKGMSSTFRLLEMFLPVELSVEYHSIGHELWLQEFMTIWENSKSSNDWEWYMMEILANLAKWNIGYIDWNPYITIMFTRFIRYLKLPVFYKYETSSSENFTATAYMAKWIVSVLGDNTCAQIYFEKFLKTIESYFQSANQGSWTRKLTELFYFLVKYFAKRLSRERFKKESWFVQTPENYKLTEINIDSFVDCMMPIAMVTIFNYNISPQIRASLQLLASMRPNIVIPKLMEKLSFSLDTSIESHKFFTVAESMSAILKPLLLGSQFYNEEYAYLEGRSLILPLLFSALPGIDPNEPRKCYKAIDLILMVSHLVPFVDCSRSTAEMTPDDQILCDSTSRLKEFLLEFMDKIFAVTNSMSLDFSRHDGGSKESSGYSETVTDYYQHQIELTFHSLLLQSNDSLFSAALDKFSNFIMENNFEVNVAGKLMSMICGVFSAVNSELTLKVLFPYLFKKIQNVLGENDESLKEENLSINLLFPLHLLEYLILNCQGKYLLPYIDEMILLLDKATCLENCEGNTVACEILGNLCDSLVNPQIIKIDKDFNDLKYPFWNDWGKSIDFDNTKLKWYIPGEKEMTACGKIFEHFFIPVINTIQNYISGKISLSRIELQKNLRIIINIIEGFETVLPHWSESPIEMENYENCTFVFVPKIGNENEIKMPDGSNVRRYFIQIAEALQAVILKNEEDDTKTLELVIELWGILSLDQTGNFQSVNDYYTQIRYRQKELGDVITRDKGYVPKMFLTRVKMQHYLRSSCADYPVTPSTKIIIQNLFKLCISKYASIRSQAQEVLWSVLNNYLNGHQLIIDDVLKILDLDPEKHHDAYKGVLYTINEDPIEAFFKIGDWPILSKLLPALVLSKPSEKLSIIDELQDISDSITESYHSINFELKLPESCLVAASSLWKTSGVSLSLPHPSQKEIEMGAISLQNLNKSNLEAYNSIFHKLITAITEEKLTSRHHIMAMQFINALTHSKYPLPTTVVNYFLQASIHYSLRDRKLGWEVIWKCLKQHKPKFTKKTINIPIKEKKIMAGRRKDNEWLQYNPNKFPVSVAEWEEPRFMHDHSVGYYTWPKEIQVYTPTLLQPLNYSSPRKLSDQEKEIDLFFSNEENLNKFIDFFAMEEKNTDKNSLNGDFNYNRYLIFKGLFKNFGDSYLNSVLSHLKKLVETKHEASRQRCAAEIVCGLVRGSKHWPYPMTANMWKKLLPIISVAVGNIMEETIKEWQTCFLLIQYRRDPNKIYWLIEFLVEDIQKVQTTSRIECVKLTFLQCIIRNQVWRLTNVLNRLQPFLETRLLDNPLNSVRLNLAATLVCIYNPNLNLLGVTKDQTNQQSDYPRIEDFVLKIYPKLTILLEEKDTESESYKKATKILNSMCAFIRYTDYSPVGLVPCFYTLYKIINQMENNEADKELARECTVTLATLARFWTSPKYVPIVLDNIDEVSNSSSWLCRLKNTEFLQVWLFHNMSTILSDESYIMRIRSIILKLLEDNRVEVRETAAKVLTGMLHCSILPNEHTLLEEFINKGQIKLHKKKTDNFDYNNAIRLRHSAVLGMCAFIQAHPYDLPDNIPPIFEYLNRHLNDPAPISATIRNTLNDFKRTHCDSWTGLEGLANIMTQEQYTFLQDLTVAPSYYA